MDPVTAVLNLATAAMTLAGKVWDATPPSLQQQNAADWATFTHSMGEVINDLNGKLKAAVSTVAAKV
jgi:hypothetical protein